MNKPRAIIVGGSSGMGLDAAQRILQRDAGVEVLLVARSEGKLAEAASRLREYGEVATESVDLYDFAQVEALGARLSQGAPVKYLVNAAGYFSPAPFVEHSVEDYDRYHDLNRATFFLTQSIVQNMRQNGGGSIVNIGSMWAKQAIKETPSSAYSMAKAGLL